MFGQVFQRITHFARIGAAGPIDRQRQQMNGIVRMGRPHRAGNGLCSFVLAVLMNP